MKNMDMEKINKFFEYFFENPLLAKVVSPSPTYEFFLKTFLFVAFTNRREGINVPSQDKFLSFCVRFERPFITGNLY